MKKILVATTNPGKISEIKHFLKDLQVELLTLFDVGIIDEPIEDGKNFEENAIIKAKYCFNKIKIPTIADDGGLEIDFFNGEPGVKSKRWIDGKVTSDEELIKYTLQKMRGLPQAKRGAQLRTVLALIDKQGITYTSEGIIRGIIAEKPCSKTTKGYPYRAIFYLPGINKYYNEHDLTKEEFERVSHRGKALQKLKKIIKSSIL